MMTIPGGSTAGFLFVVVLFAYVLQTELTQYVQATLHYRQPYLLFYLAHSAFALVLPLHLIYLKISTGISPLEYLNSLWRVMHYRVLAPRPSAESHSKFPWPRYIVFMSLLTVGITCPGLLWYASVSLAPISDITAIFNTHAFWAYLLSTALLPPPPEKPRWQPYKLLAVLLACGGVFATVYGTSDDGAAGITGTPSASNPFLGNMLALISAISYALYQVGYKKWAVPCTSSYQSLAVDEGAPLSPPPEFRLNENLPFGLFPNFITSTAGLATFGVLWIPIVLSNLFAQGGFELPGDWWTTSCICLIAVSGLVFNAGFMVLLALWGPIIASVGNLLTIVLVMMVDVLLSRDLSVITFWSFIGSGLIISGFGILVWEYTIQP